MALAACAAARAGVVQTVAGRLAGSLQVAGDGLTVGEKPVAWRDVVYLVRDEAPGTLSASQAVRTTGGELWHLQITGWLYQQKQLAVRSSLFGEKLLEGKDLSAIDFAAGLGEPPQVAGGVLFRDRGEPIPGSLVRVDPDTISILSPLGVLSLELAAVTRYVLPAAKRTGAPAGDELRLRDGSIFRGSVEPRPGKLHVEHPVLGAMEVPLSAVRSVRREHPRVAYVDDLPAGSARAVPLIRRAVAPRFVQAEEAAGGGETGRPAFIRGICVEPKATIRLTPPPGAVRFVASVNPAARGPTAGACLVHVRVGGRTAYDETVGPADRPPGASVELSRPGQVEIEVDFRRPIRLPAGVVLGDPHWVLAKGKARAGASGRP